MKRKADELDEGLSWGSWSPSNSSNRSTSSYGSPQKTVGSLPWPRPMASNVNLRTRKRVRDNRPNEDAIHQNTLAKLFSAQRQPESIAVAGGSLGVPPSAVASISQSVPSPAQRNLHSFFAISHQPTSVDHIVPTKPGLVAELIGACEDCGNTLNLLARVSCLDTEMMDLDTAAQLAYDDDYACANCHRRVCDTCAVRGDHRLCLECAIPGGG